MDVRTICLGILTLGDATGYEIRKMFAEGAIGEVFDANFGSIYPALNRLTDEGLVSCTAHAQEGRPDKKVYSITEAGRTVFGAEVMKTPGPDRFRSEFIVTVLFSHLLPRARLKQLLDDRLAKHRAEIAELENLDGARDRDLIDTHIANHAFVVGWGLAHHRAAVAYIEANRHLIEGRQRPIADVAE